MAVDNFEDRLRESIIATFPQQDDRARELYSIVEYQLGWRNQDLKPEQADGGKKLRPLLCVLCCQMAGGNVDQAFPLAAALQLFHEHTLVHDDIEDRSTLRRGRPTVWHLWGEGIGVNVGSLINILARRALSVLMEKGVPAETVLDIMTEFETTSLQVAEGQHLDLSFEDRLSVNMTEYLSMIERKTAKLIAASASLGAKVGGGDSGVIEALRAFGLNMGLAFQIQDDWIGTWGKPEETGKPFAIDILEKKKNLPIVQLLALADETDRNVLEVIYSKSTLETEDVQLIMSLLEKYTVRQRVEDEIAKFYQIALDSLSQIKNEDPNIKQELKDILDKLMHRSR